PLSANSWIAAWSRAARLLSGRPRRRGAGSPGVRSPGGASSGVTSTGSGSGFAPPRFARPRGWDGAVMASSEVAAVLAADLVERVGDLAEAAVLGRIEERPEQVVARDRRRLERAQG